MSRRLRTCSDHARQTRAITACLPGWRERVLVLGALAIVGLTVACGQDAPESGSRPSSVSGPQPSMNATTTAPGTTSTTWTPQQQEIVDALRRAMAAWDRAAEVGHGFIPEMEASFVDPMLSHTRNVIFDDRRKGVLAKYPVNSVHELTPLQVSFDQDTGKVTACLVDDAVMYEVTSGSIVNDHVVTALVRFTMRRVDGSWKVSEYLIQNRTEGASTCDEL
jgi:hypothetical protein